MIGFIGQKELDYAKQRNQIAQTCKEIKDTNYKPRIQRPWVEKYMIYIKEKQLIFCLIPKVFNISPWYWNYIKSLSSSCCMGMGISASLVPVGHIGYKNAVFLELFWGMIEKNVSFAHLFSKKKEGQVQQPLRPRIY